MATINNFSDILSAMEQNPELQEAMRNHVLGEELRQLPAIVRRQGEQLAEALERLDELAATIRNVAEQISSYALASSRAITAIVERQDRVEADIAELKAAQGRLEASVQDMRESLARMEARQDRMENDIAELKTEQATTNRRLNRIEGQLGNLNGWRLESDVHKNISSIVPRYLMLHGTYVLKSGILPQTNELDNILLQARRDGRITLEQTLEALDADIIATAEDDDDRKYVIVAEVAHTLDDSDITRANQRSRIMADAMAITGIAVAIAPRIALHQRELAALEGVTIVQTPDADSTPQRPSDWTTPR